MFLFFGLTRLCQVPGIPRRGPPPDSSACLHPQYQRASFVVSGRLLLLPVAESGVSLHGAILRHLLLVLADMIRFAFLVLCSGGRF